MDQIENLLTRGVDKIYPTKEALEKVLRSGKKLRLYQGFDPTGDRLHIGHMVGFRKHRQWQDLGHEVIFLIGDGTGLAGDPSGKKKSRDKFFSREELRANARDYLSQASKIVRFEGENPIKILYNGDWLTQLKLEDILSLAGNFTVQQMIERDMYQDRLRANEPINLREFLYPLLQGYDSVAMDVDLELGGTDQTFNMLAGRTLLKAVKNKEKFVMTLPLLADSKGVKIGKSEGNVIGLTDEPNDLFGKIMSLGDDIIVPLFTLLTDTPQEEIDSISSQISSGTNPMQFKIQVAQLIISQLHSNQAAGAAKSHFESTFQKGIIPSTLPEIPVSSTNIVDVLVEAKLASSKSDAKRLIEQKAVEVNEKKVTSIAYVLPPSPSIVKVGRRFVRILQS